MRIKALGIILLLSLTILFYNCKGDSQSGAGAQANGATATCIYDKAAVKADPMKNGKFVTSMSLGEKVTYLGEEKIDIPDNNRKYYKIKLSDGKEGWASEYGIALDTRPAIALTKTTIYSRPDLVTGTNKFFNSMEFVALGKSEGEWCEARGSVDSKKKGWIKLSSVSTNDIDITVGLLAARAVSEPDKTKRMEKIDEILNNTAFASSFMYDTLRYWKAKGITIDTSKVK